MFYQDEDEFEAIGVSDIYRQLLKMLDDRGYDVEAERKTSQHMNEETFWKHYRTWDNLNQRFHWKNAKFSTQKNKVDLQVIWIPPTIVAKNDKIKVDQLTKELNKVAPKKNDSDILFISDKPLGSPASGKLEMFKPYYVEFWTYERIMIDPTEHILVDAIEVISNDEALTMMEVLQIKPKQLPIISTQDQLSRWLGLRPNDVIRNLTDVEYRIVRPINHENTPISSYEVFTN